MCNLVDMQIMHGIYIMIDVQMLIVMYMLFIVCYDIRCACAMLWHILHNYKLKTSVVDDNTLNCNDQTHVNALVDFPDFVDACFERFWPCLDLSFVVSA